MQVKSINDYFWYWRQVSEGTKGPIAYEFTRRQVVLSATGLPQKTVWLFIRRTIGDNPEYSYFLSNASSSTRLRTLVWLSGMRWAIEQITWVQAQNHRAYLSHRRRLRELGESHK